MMVIDDDVDDVGVVFAGSVDLMMVMMMVLMLFLSLFWLELLW